MENVEKSSHLRRNNILLFFAALVVIAAIYPGLPLLYHYAVYNSLCLDTKSNNRYLLRGVNPDLASTQVFIKDVLLLSFAQTTTEPGYPFAIKALKDWPFRWEFLAFVNQAFHTYFSVPTLTEERPTYRIHLNSKNQSIQVSFFRETDYYTGAIPGFHIYTLPLGAAVPPQFDGSFVQVEVHPSSTFLSDLEWQEEYAKLNKRVSNALDRIKKCVP